MIAAAILAHNAAATIGAALRSLHWCDVVYLFDDHCTDETVSTASESHPNVKVERSTFGALAFEVGEISIRNHMLDRVQATLSPTVVVLMDADEIMDSSVRPFAEQVRHHQASCVSVSIFHLFDGQQYIAYRETTKNGLYQVDPHVRIIQPSLRYECLRPGQVSHPLMRAHEGAVHIHGPFHFHLKYLAKARLPNHSLEFLPQYPNQQQFLPFLRQIEFRLPLSVRQALSGLRIMVDDQAPELPVTYSESSATLQNWLLVTTGAPEEQAILARVVQLLSLRRYVHRLYIVASETDTPSSISVGDICLKSTDFLLNAARLSRWDVILQLSPIGAIMEHVESLSSLVKRGVRSLTDECFIPYNILGIGYCRILSAQASQQEAPILASFACELE